MSFRVACGVLLLGLILAPSAIASTRAAGGPIQIWATLGTGPVAKILVTGAIGDYGTATTINKNGKVAENGDYVKIVLKKGGFEVNSVALNKKLNAEPPKSINKSTCSAVFGGSGTVTLFNGSGAYAGISGTIHVTETFAGIGRRYTSGPKKGQCIQSQNTPPVAFFGTVQGAGVVKFG